MKRLAKLTIVPTDTKEKNFVLALVDYMNKEFKNHNLKTSKKNSYVKVDLSNRYMDKYSSVIVDCCSGKMYLRGENCKDKYFGRLSKFKVGRPSDAYYCVNYNATRIINRINKIENSFQNKISLADTKNKFVRVVDLRIDEKVKVADLRVNETAKVADLRIHNDVNFVDLRNCTKVKVADLRMNIKVNVADLRMNEKSKVIDLRNVMDNVDLLIKVAKHFNRFADLRN